MTWILDHWLDLLGWGGSVLLVYSLLQSSVLRLRVLNLVACVVLIVFNALLSVWPMVGMNLALVVINAWFVVSMLRERHDSDAFEVLQVSPDDEYLRHVLRVHGEDILAFNPGFVHDPYADDQEALLVMRGDETVGVVLLSVQGDTAHIVLDYVTARYRDFSPGEFVWRRADLLAERGVRRVLSRPDMVDAYYDKVGFTRLEDRWLLEIPQ